MSERKKVVDMAPKRRKPALKAASVSSKPVIKAKKKAVKPASDVAYFPTLEKKGKKGKGSMRTPIIIGIICLCIIILAIGWVRATASVIVTPKTQQFSLLNMPLTAYKEATSSDALSYGVIDVKDEQHGLVPATNGPAMEVKAKGTVILYNTFTNQSQKIYVGTRLSNTVGKIYLTTKTVTIPGYTIAPLKNGTKGKAAGSVPVPVSAEVPGPDYNIVPTDLTGDFKIVAYKGNPKYDTIYGRLNPLASISGGFIGNKQIIATSTLAQNYSLLQQTVQTRLIAKAKALVPEGYVLFDGAYSIDYGTLDPKPASSSADIGVTASFHGILFRQHDLTRVIGKNKKIDIDAAFPDNQYTEKNMNSLAFTMVNPKSFSFASSTPLSFSLTGNYSAVASIDTQDLVKHLIGRSMAQGKALFNEYHAIAEIHATISPFWRFTFPDSSNRITVTQKE